MATEGTEGTENGRQKTEDRRQSRPDVLRG